MEKNHTLRSFGNQIWGFMKDNYKEVALNIVAEYFGIPVSYDFQKKLAGRRLETIMTWPRNSAEAAIEALLKNGKNQWSDASKVESAKEIYNLAKGQDDATRTFAIRSIQELQDNVWSDLSKGKINKLIASLATAEGDTKNE